jgi:hypothetical protein
MNSSTIRREGRGRRSTWLAALTSVAVLGLAAGTVLATDLHQTPPIAWNDSGFQGSGEDCDEVDLAPGDVLWHFVLVQTDADTGNLTATFEDAGVLMTASYKHSGGVLHFAIITGHDTLLGASTDVDGDKLNLSHICAGPEQSATPTPTPSQSSEEETPTPTPSQSSEEETPTPTPSQSSEEETPTPTPESSVQGGTGTPAPSIPDGAMEMRGGPSPIPTILFAMILLSSLGTLAWANVRTTRTRR